MLYKNELMPFNTQEVINITNVNLISKIIYKT